jgi:hypothetical protein
MKLLVFVMIVFLTMNLVSAGSVVKVVSDGVSSLWQKLSDGTTQAFRWIDENCKWYGTSGGCKIRRSIENQN